MSNINIPAQIKIKVLYPIFTQIFAFITSLFINPEQKELEGEFWFPSSVGHDPDLSNSKDNK